MYENNDVRRKENYFSLVFASDSHFYGRVRRTFSSEFHHTHKFFHLAIPTTLTFHLQFYDYFLLLQVLLYARERETGSEVTFKTSSSSSTAAASEYFKLFMMSLSAALFHIIIIIIIIHFLSFFFLVIVIHVHTHIFI